MASGPFYRFNRPGAEVSQGDIIIIWNWWRQGMTGGTVTIYPGFSHGMCTVNAEVINRDLLGFIQG